MKKYLFLASALLMPSLLFAQKYVTRSGKVSFFSTTPIENIEAFNNDVVAVLDAKSGDVAFQLPVKSFKFEKELMQEHFNDNYMESDKYPKSEFRGKLTNPSAVNYSKNGSYPVTVTGNLTMHGITHPVSVPGTVTVDGQAVTLQAKFPVKTDDYKIKIPSVANGKIAKEIEVTVNSVLKSGK